MDIASIGSMIGSIGFPIVMCLLMYNQMGEQAEQHKEEMNKLTETLNNNTIAITQLTSKLENTGVIK